MALDQEGFRWRNDDGSESAATWKAAQDSSVSIALDTALRLRVLVDNAGASSGTSYFRLEARRTGSPTEQWFDVAPSGSPVITTSKVQQVPSSNITAGGEDTTAQLTAPAGSPKSFTAGRIWDDESGADTITVGADQYTELEWNLRAVSANGAVNGDVYEFRVTRKASSANIAFVDADSAKSSSVANLETPALTVSGANRILIAAICWGDGTPATFSSLKWGGSGGTTMTPLGSTLNIGSFHRLQLAYLVAPTEATQTVYGALSGDQNEICVGGASFTGVNQSSPLGTEATNTGSGTGSSFTATVNVSSEAGELVIDIAYGGSTAGVTASCTVATPVGQTQRWEQESINNFSAGAQSTEPGAGTVTMSEDFTFSVSDDFAWGILAVPLKPA